MRQSKAALIVALTLSLGGEAFPDSDCGVVVSPEQWAELVQLKKAGAYELPGGIAGAEDYVIPVTFHVVRRSDGTGGINESLLVSGLASTNAEFAGAGMSFCKVGPTYYVDSDYYYFEANTQSDIYQLWTIGRVPGTVNVYLLPFLTIEGGPICGLASFTNIPIGGLAVRYSCMGGSNVTFPHEMGHYFNLFHTHEGVQCTAGANCELNGDLVCDTPPDPTLGIHNVVAGCIYVGNEPDPCGTNVPFDPLVDNIMSYAPNPCRDEFTPGQLLRARATLINLRPELALLECPSGTGPSVDLSRISVNTAGAQSNGHSNKAALSADGRFVVFASEATNLDPRDTSPIADVYLRDRLSATTELVSISLTGTSGNGASGWASVSADGRFVVFESTATNLTSNVTIPFKQLYLRDRQNQTTVLISVSTGGSFANSDSHRPVITPDGQFIVYYSDSTNLVNGDSNGARDVFVHDWQNGQTSRVSVSSTGAQGNDGSPASFDTRVAISTDGRFVAFGSAATNFLAKDANGPFEDVFVHDRQTGATVLAGVSSNGVQGDFGSSNPSISADGRFVAFQSVSSNLAPDPNGLWDDVFLHDRQSGETTLVGVNAQGQQYPMGSSHGSISHDGRRLVFQQLIATPNPSTNNVYMRDLVSGEHVRLNPPIDGVAGGFGTKLAAISGNGNLATYQSDAANLVNDDTNQRTDVFSFALPGQPLELGDVNGDGAVDVNDLLLVVGAWGPCTACPADLNGDGIVNVIDLLEVIAHWD